MLAFRYAVIFVSDIERSIEFYRDVLGLPLKSSSKKWAEFDTPEVILALHHVSAGGQTSADVPADIPGQCQIGFTVPDMAAFHRRMVAAGVTCVDLPSEQSYGGKLAIYADPDGMPFSVGEMPE